MIGIASGGPIVLEGAASCEAVTAATFVAANVGRHVLSGRKVLAVVLVMRLHVEVVPVILLLRLLVASTRVPTSALLTVLAAAIVVLARMICWHLLVVVGVFYLLMVGLMSPVASTLRRRNVAAMVEVRMGVLGIFWNEA